MNKTFVNKNDICREEDLPAETEKARDEFVEILARGQGACRLARLDEHAPDISQALRGVSSHLLVVAQELEENRKAIAKFKEV